MKKRAKEAEEVEDSLINKGTALLFGIFLVIGIVFFVSLSIVKSGNNLQGTSGNVALSPNGEGDFNFGIGEIVYALVFAFLITGFLIWTKSVIVKNPYLGLIIGIVGGAIIGYGFSRRYWGTYSLMFMAVCGLVIISYLGKNFFKYINKNASSEEDED